MVNKFVRGGVIGGLVLGIPFFFLIAILETGVLMGDNGICPYHKYEIQNTLGDSEGQLICNSERSEKIPDGQIIAGTVCIEGVYYETNYRCITKTMGFKESEGDFFTPIILAEFYGALLGGLIGWGIFKLSGKGKR